MKWVKRIGVVFLLLVVAAYSGRLWIYGQAVAVGKDAVAQHEGDRVEALLALLEDPEADLETMNEAIWALGQLGDPRAVAALESLRTGAPCDHETGVCQRELEKALKACNGGWDLMFWK